MSMRMEALILITIGFSASFAWYKLWVEPNDKARYEIMECMGSDNSRAAFDYCIDMRKKK